MTQALKAVVDSMRGSVQLSAANVPSGHVTITRTERRTPEVIRGGEFDVSTGGFIREDAEPPFGYPLTYQVADAVTARSVQSNRILNPKAKANTNTWATAAGRTVTRETAAGMIPPRDALTSLRVSNGPIGASSLADRTLLSAVPSALASGRWFLTGQMYYDTPDLWSWQEVLDNGTWQGAKNLGTWQQVKSKSSEAANQPFATLWATVLGPNKTASEHRRNLVPNPAMAVATTSWFVAAGTGGTAAITRVATGGPNNSAFARSTYTVANTTAAGVGSAAAIVADGRGSASYPMPVTPGQAYSAAMQVRSSIAQLLDCRIQWYDAANVALAGAAAQTAGAASVVLANTWTRLTVQNAVAPAGAAYARVTAFAPDGAGAVPFPIGATLDGTQGQLEKATTIGTYFDGSTAAVGDLTYTWAGTANASASIETLMDYPALVAPFQVLGVQAIGGNQWHTFSAWMDVPAGLPAGSKLALLQGNLTREFGVTWWLTTLMLTPEAEMISGGLPYLDGDTPLPANPAANMVPGYDWYPLTNDASIIWNGTDGVSVSVYTGPSIIGAKATVTVAKPDSSLLPRVRQPVFLSDPVVPQLSQWFELVAIGPLSYKARADLYDVLGRGPQIAVSQKRSWASGEFRLMTYSLEAESVVDRLFASGRILFYRNPDPRYPESGWYLHIGDVQSSRLGDQFGPAPERVWSVPFVRVERPVGLIAASNSISWADIKAGYTWDELRVKREDWLDAALTAAGT